MFSFTKRPNLKKDFFFFWRGGWLGGEEAGEGG